MVDKYNLFYGYSTAVTCMYVHCSTDVPSVTILLSLNVIGYEKGDHIIHFMDFTFAVLFNTTLPQLHVAISFTSTVAEICTL